MRAEKVTFFSQLIGLILFVFKQFQYLIAALPLQIQFFHSKSINSGV
jgi:hypothetical protein